MSHRVWPVPGVALAASLTFMAGCASKSHVVNLREPGELPVPSGSAATYAYSDSTWAPAVVGHLSTDSLSIYRSRDGVWYRWQARAVAGEGVAIGGYTLADGRHVRFEGHIRRSGDSLAFERFRRRRGMEAPQGPDTVVLPLEGVRSVNVWLPDAGRTAMALGVVLVFSAAAFALVAAASFEQSSM